ncbi:MAG: cobyrinic acid a,c-diamide synthase, partial [Rhodospirillales bacterium]|nr:cobyrinic acid a,c-diamide synthase [Rhodospirillales bacterium]
SRTGAADIPAHEFHYASLDGDLGGIDFAYGVERGFGIDGKRDGLKIHNLTACFSHQRDTDANHWVERFLNLVRDTNAEARGDQPAAVNA